MKSGKMGFALAAAATMMLTASLALAKPGGPAGPGYGPCGGAIAQLSPEKQEAYQKLSEAYYNKTAQMRAELGVKRAELNAVAVAPNPDAAKINALSKDVGDLMGKLVAERTQFRIQVAKEIGVSALGGRGFGPHHGSMGGGYGPMGGGLGGCQ
jgi:zinc resistance-associated protein